MANRGSRPTNSGVRFAPLSSEGTCRDHDGQVQGCRAVGDPMTDRAGPVADSIGLSGEPRPQPGQRSTDLSTLRRGLEILDTLRQCTWACDARGWGNNRIAEHLGADKSQVSRTLKVLVEAGLVVRDEETRTYRLGWGAYSLGMRATDQHLMRVGSVIVRKVVSVTGSRVFLVVRDGASAVTIWSDAPLHVRPIVDSIGMVYPVESTETGRALLYGSDPVAIRQILGVGTEDNPRADEFIRRVARDRQVGFSYGVLPGDSAGVVAVPIWTTGRKVIAALGATSKALAHKANVTPVVRVLLATATELTQHLTADLRAEVAVSAVPYQGWPARPELTSAR
ncbi:hypothetical protein EEB14_56170 [Rhodococcus sp. WS4]|nr:hypothetical protein EEB14_56170 [Rhodococcus sp. WS4]